MEFGVSALKGISGNEHVTDFVLYDWGERDQVLQSILGRLSTDVQSQFTTGEYTTCGDTFPCIRLSASGEYWQYCCCLLQPSVPPIAILWVPTFELVCTSFMASHSLLCSCSDGMCCMVLDRFHCMVYSWLLLLLEAVLTVHRHSATCPDEVCHSLKYLVWQGSEVCMKCATMTTHSICSTPLDLLVP